MSNNNNTWNINNNDEIPESIFDTAPLTGRNLANAKGINKFQKNFNKSWSNEHPNDPTHVNEYVPLTKKSNNTYSKMIANWKARNVTKNKKYKTLANYNAENNAKFKAELTSVTKNALSNNMLARTAAMAAPVPYWIRNKQKANQERKEKMASYFASHRGTTKRKSRRSGRKSRKNRK